LKELGIHKLGDRKRLLAAFAYNIDLPLGGTVMITVSAGIWLEPECSWFSYANPEHCAKQAARVREEVMLYRDHPALLAWGVGNEVEGDGTNIPVQLKFNSLEDFEPGRVLDQVEPLRKLLDTRNRLRELMNVVDRSEDLEVELEKLLINADDIKKLAAEMGLPKTDGAAKAGDGAKAGDPAAPAAEPKTPNTPEGEPK
jgi:hypothetical protein